MLKVRDARALGHIFYLHGFTGLNVHYTIKRSCELNILGPLRKGNAGEASMCTW